MGLLEEAARLGVALLPASDRENAVPAGEYLRVADPIATKTIRSAQATAITLGTIKFVFDK
jgi:hypothetical protein